MMTVQKHEVKEVVLNPDLCVRRFDLAVRRWAGKQKDSVRICFGSPFSSEAVVCGHCLALIAAHLYVEVILVVAV